MLEAARRDLSASVGADQYSPASTSPLHVEKGSERSRETAISDSLVCERSLTQLVAVVKDRTFPNVDQNSFLDVHSVRGSDAKQSFNFRGAGALAFLLTVASRRCLGKVSTINPFVAALFRGG